MAATRADVDRWIKTAHETDCDYIISVCDTFDYDDYPVYCKTFDELHEKYHEYSGKSMQKINEIIRVYHDGTAEENLQLHNLL
jgi:hypothetical protein